VPESPSFTREFLSVDDLPYKSNAGFLRSNRFSFASPVRISIQTLRRSGVIVMLLLSNHLPLRHPALQAGAQGAGYQ
jgi:hypothetical protein